MKPTTTAILAILTLFTPALAAPSGETSLLTRDMTPRGTFNEAEGEPSTNLVSLNSSLSLPTSHSLWYKSPN